LAARELRARGLKIDRLALRRLIGLLHLTRTAREVRAAAHDDARAVARARAAGERDLERRPEELSDAFEVALRRRADQPHQQKEGDHRRYEVRVRDLPRAAVMAAALDLSHPLDDERSAVRIAAHRVLLLRGGGLRRALHVLLELREAGPLGGIQDLAPEL